MTTSLAPPQENVQKGATVTEDRRIWFAQMLRAVAVTLVVFEHLALGFWVNPVNQVHYRVGTGPAWLSYFFTLQSIIRIPLGTLGVAIFFLISGFVIPFSLSRLKPVGFLVARCFRIFPTYAVTLLLTCLTLAAVSGHFRSALGQYLIDYWWSFSLLGEFLSKPSIEPVIWTLRVELIFYITCAAITGVSSLKRSTTIAKLAIGLASINLFFAYLNNTYMLSREAYELITHLTRCVSSLLLMLVGTCFYNLFKTNWTLRRCLAVSSVCIVLSLGVLASHRAYGELGIPFGASYIAGTLIFASAFFLRDTLKQNRITNFVANISYPLYLTHCAAGGALLICFQKFCHNAYISLFATSFILIAVSYILHIGVELRSNEFGKQLAKGITNG